jgi:hypothetical protein
VDTVGQLSKIKSKAPPMNKKIPKVGLGILLNLADIVVAFFLVFGGWNATVSHPMTGYISMAMAPILLYFSSGMWTKRNWQLISRLVLYAGSFVVSGVSTAVVRIGHGPFPDDVVVYLVVSGLFVIVLLSALHLRLMTERAADMSFHEKAYMLVSCHSFQRLANGRRILA